MKVFELFFMACVTMGGGNLDHLTATTTTCTWYPGGLYQTKVACEREGAAALGTPILGFTPRGKREQFKCAEHGVSE